MTRDTGPPVRRHSLNKMRMIRLNSIEGNGWAAMGMLRVLGTMKHSQFSGSFKKQMKDLGNWAFEIQQAMYPQLVRSVIFTLNFALI